MRIQMQGDKFFSEENYNCKFFYEILVNKKFKYPVHQIFWKEISVYKGKYLGNRYIFRKLQIFLTKMLPNLITSCYTIYCQTVT